MQDLYHCFVYKVKEGRHIIIGIFTANA